MADLNLATFRKIANSQIKNLAKVSRYMVYQEDIRMVYLFPAIVFKQVYEVTWDVVLRLLSIIIIIIMRHVRMCAIVDVQVCAWFEERMLH